MATSALNLGTVGVNPLRKSSTQAQRAFRAAPASAMRAVVQCSQSSEGNTFWRARVGAGLAAAALFISPALDPKPAAAGIFSGPPQSAAVAKPSEAADPLEELIDARIRLALQKYDLSASAGTGLTTGLTMDDIKKEIEIYVPQKQPLDKTSLYAKLLSAIGATLAVTLILENSNLFPTIVAANKQYDSKKSSMGSMDETEVSPDPPPFEMESMLEDARGGLDMFKSEAAKSQMLTTEQIQAEAANSLNK